MSTAADNNLEFEGVVEYVTFKNTDTGYGVLKMKVDPKRYRNNPCVSKQGRVTLVGPLVSVEVGARLRVLGRLTHDPRFGAQCTVSQFVETEPKSQAEKIQYLAKNVFQIGPHLAEKIVKHLGDDVFERIDADPNVLDDIPGIGAKRLASIKKAWPEQREYRALLLFMTQIGLTATYIDRILKTYKSAKRATEVIKSDPYRLARDIDGIGFTRADEVAKHLGVHELSEIRIRAACEHVVAEAANEGHCFVWADDVCDKVAKFLKDPQNITPGVVGQMLQRAIEQRILVVEGKNRIYTPAMARAENFVAKRLRQILDRPMPVQCTGQQMVQEILRAAAASTTVTLDPVQCEAIYRTLSSKASVITGGPGVGKTTITKAVVAGFRTTHLPIMLLAPTGRAAKRMAQVIEADAKTIHRHLFSLHKAVRDGHLTLEEAQMRGIVIVDEVSMMDLKLAAWLLEYLHEDAILVIVGDKDQLPSVGAGAVLRDLLQCSAIPKTQLTQIFRQAAGSKIIVNAHKINQGVMPMWDYLTRNSAWPTTDMWCAIIEDAEEQAQCAVWACTELARQKGFDPTRDVMVLAPMKSGASGVFNLNTLLQRSLNPQPPKAVERPGGIIWGVGDKVMQFRNNYNLGVLNGDTGVIVDMLVEEQQLRGLKVDFDGDIVEYTGGDQWCDLNIAYASTIHKVQGSEAPMVVICLHGSHFKLLQRQLFYTGVTRGKQFVLVITAAAALSRAIQNNEVAHRNTFLAEKVAQQLR